MVEDSIRLSYIRYQHPTLEEEMLIGESPPPLLEIEAVGILVQENYKIVSLALFLDGNKAVKVLHIPRHLIKERFDHTLSSFIKTGKDDTPAAWAKVQEPTTGGGIGAVPATGAPTWCSPGEKVGHTIHPASCNCVGCDKAREEYKENYAEGPV